MHSNIHSSNIEIAKKWKQKKIHKQMNGQKEEVYTGNYSHYFDIYSGE